jgi:hypothetical protein
VLIIRVFDDRQKLLRDVTMPVVFLALAGLLALGGPLVFGVVSGGVTATKVIRGLLGLALLGVAAFGGLLCVVGFEAVSTGLNPGPWWGTFGTLVIAPLLGYVYFVAKLFGSPRPDKQDVPPEV